MPFNPQCGRERVREREGKPKTQTIATDPCDAQHKVIKCRCHLFIYRGIYIYRTTYVRTDWGVTSPRLINNAAQPGPVLCVLRLSQTIRIVGPVFLSPLSTPLPFAHSRSMPNDSYWCHKLGDLRVCLPVRLPLLGLYIVFHCCFYGAGTIGKCCVNNAKENSNLKMKT